MDFRILHPNDIPDEDVREWYFSKQMSDNIFWINVNDLISEDIFEHYKSGYERFVSDGCILKEDNPYLLWLNRITKDFESDTCYQKWSVSRLNKVALDRMGLIASMQNGFRINAPISLLSYKFQHLHRKNIFSRDGRAITFDTYDGHHRVVAAKMVGLNYVPAIMGNWPKRKISYIEELSAKNNWDWYQPIDFQHPHNIKFDNPNDKRHGVEKYKFIIRRNLHPIAGNRFLDVGCNSGVISACIAEEWAAQVVGIDYPCMIKQTWAVQETLWVDYGNLVFRGMDLLNLDAFNGFFKLFGEADCVLMSNFLYYLGDKTDDFIDICSKNSRRIVVQGNHLKKAYNKVLHYRKEYSQISGMVALLKRHGFSTKVDAPLGYSKPVVTGSQQFTPRVNNV